MSMNGFGTPQDILTTQTLGVLSASVHDLSAGRLISSSVA
jgi:hypothetical protein